VCHNAEVQKGLRPSWVLNVCHSAEGFAAVFPNALSAWLAAEWIANAREPIINGRAQYSMHYYWEGSIHGAHGK